MNKRQGLEPQLRLRLAASNLQELPPFCTLRDAGAEDTEKEVFQIKGKSTDGTRMELAATVAKGFGRFFFKEQSTAGFVLGKVGDSVAVGVQAWLVENRTKDTFCIKHKTLTEADRGRFAYSK